MGEAQALPLLHMPTLLVVACVVTAVVAAIMSVFGSTQHVYRGFWWWAAAQWLASAGIGLQLLHDGMPASQLLSVALLLQWPITLLIGMRRFHARSALPGSARVDLMLLAGASLVWLVAWAGPGSPVARVTAFSVGMAGLSGYAAWVLGRLPAHKHQAPIRALRTLLLANALMAAVHLAQVSGVPRSIEGSAVLLVLISTVCMFHLCMQLTYERTTDNLRESQRQLRVLADMDMLTQVPNRRHFEDLARQILAMRTPGSATLMLFDIDHFKRVNDEQGHAAGDEALRLVARCARQVLRTADVVGRLGGDEFAALLPHTSAHAALLVADRIVVQLENECRQRRTQRLSLSFGAVQTLPGESLDEALLRADKALYEAKRQGRCRAVAGSQQDGEAVFRESKPLGLTAL